ncbi:methylthioribulose-1-phosphate dehydratase-like isoform X2 [Amphiura filiformis]|uniref:methylthioribulose-1-phosphate dehydratase-like isoform X2 n=1 Tax=Amphiura filiformis TaxID=82378 RepID=UPI003B21F822
MDHPRRRIPELFRLFWNLGWTVGAGGSLSIRKGDDIYFPPSGVQKERIQPEDIFVTNMKGEIIDGPASDKNMKISTCKPVFMKAYKHRDSGAVMHTHSPNAVLITILYPGKEFRITHQQALLGIKKCSSGRNYVFHEELVIPIVENALEEAELKDRVEKVITEYPDASAVLVRRHGIFVWGDSWVKVKIMLESYDYLFDIAIKMKQFGMDPGKVPTDEHGIV